MTEVLAEAQSIWTQLAGYKPEQISTLIDRIFSKYNQSFVLLAVDHGTNKVKIRLNDGRKVELPI